MMKKLFLLVVFAQMLGCSLHAQNIEMSFNAGTNFTFVPNFNNPILIINDGLVIPGLIHPSNSRTPLLYSSSTSETKTRLGFSFDFELSLRVAEKLKMSLSAGLTQMSYDYNTTVNTAGTPVVELENLSESYGNTDLLYLSLKPLSLSSDFFNEKLNLQLGFLLHILAKSEYNNSLVLYSNPNNGEQTIAGVDKVYFESIGKMNNVLYGLGLRASYQIIKDIDVFVSGQYYFNSIYDTEKDAYENLEDCKPALLQAGITWTICKCGGRKKQ